MHPLLLLLVAMATRETAADGGDSEWIEYSPGSCNIVVAAPHGGWLRPSAIRPRTNGCLDAQASCLWQKGCAPASAACRAATGTDLHTYQVATSLVRELSERHGCRPHFVGSKLHRSRLDPNRDIDEAAQGDELAQAAWRQYHDHYLASAVASVAEQFGCGFVLDIHGQAHAEQWTEIGVLLSKSELNRGDYDLARSSIRRLGRRSSLTGRELVAGQRSLGGLLEARGYKSVPSPSHPAPGNGGFFSGGYTTRRFGSATGDGCVDALQVEIASGIRRDAERREQFARHLADAVAEFRRIHY